MMNNTFHIEAQRISEVLSKFGFELKVKDFNKGFYLGFLKKDANVCLNVSSMTGNFSLEDEYMIFSFDIANFDTGKAFSYGLYKKARVKPISKWWRLSKPYDVERFHKIIESMIEVFESEIPGMLRGETFIHTGGYDPRM